MASRKPKLLRPPGACDDGCASSEAATLIPGVAVLGLLQVEAAQGLVRARVPRLSDSPLVRIDAA